MIGVVVVFSVCVSSFCDFFCGLFRCVGLGQFLCFFCELGVVVGCVGYFFVEEKEGENTGSQPSRFN